MAISISGSNSISGLGGSDTNFDTTLKNLKKIESLQMNRLESWKGDWSLRYQAFGKVIEAVQQSRSILSTLSNRNNFVTKNSITSNENVITAIANASAQDTQHKINVSQVASNSVWANTGHIFSSKTDIINTSGAKQDFKFTYAGKDHAISIPANTTLDSFVSIVNNASSNPGIKISLVQSGGGYVFQVAGKESGAANNLIVHSTNLVGMDSASASSGWITNDGLDPSATLTNPSSFSYDLIMQDGTKYTVNAKGNLSVKDLAATINAQTNRSIASIDASGNLVLDRVKSMRRRESSAEKDVPATTTVRVTDLSGKLSTASPPEMLTFQINVDDGISPPGTREVTISSDATMGELLAQIGGVTGNTTGTSLNPDGSRSSKLAGVTGISLTSGTFDMTKLQQTSEPATSHSIAQGTLASASTTLTFDKNKLATAISSASPPVDLIYTIAMKDGSAKTINIRSDATNQDLINATKAALGSGYTEAVDADGNTTLKIDNSLGFAQSKGTGGMGGVTASVETSFTTPLLENDPLESPPPDLKYSITKNDGTTVEITLASGSTMQNVMDAFTSHPGLDASIVDSKGKPWDPATSEGKPYLKIKDIRSATGQGITGQVAESSNWSIQRSTNARFTVDNWPTEMESASNKVTDVIDGVIFTIQDKGEARISISTDVASVEQSVQDFLDAINNVLLTVRTFTDYDEDRDVTSSDPNDIGKDNYSPSQLTSEKGGLLQGNYGVQLFRTRVKSLVTSSPPGFTGRDSATDLLSGDVLANLANLGIKTCTDESDDNFGLLVIAPKSGIDELQTLDKENYSKMITENLEGVVDFFCTSGTGSSTSADFRYASHIEGLTKPGLYDVTYDVAADGSITKVMVGGIEATRDTTMNGNWYSVGGGDAKGLAIQIDNLAPGQHKGEVRIKQGLVQTMDKFFKDELNFTAVKINANDTPDKIADAVALKSKNGALMVLRENYKTIMDNIDAKISREQTRIETWERRQKLIFANLETLLKQYSENQKSLESQLNQLSGNS